MKNRLRVACISGLVLVLAGCSTPVRAPAVPEDGYLDAEVRGMPGVRYYIDIDADPFVLHAWQSFLREKNHLQSEGLDGPLPPVAFLAISGGGDKGAFGAGVLVGWSERGTRPDFKVVTGISTGALTAPFAFLGSDYDDQLRQVYTEVSTKDILERRPFLDAIFGDSAADNTPLQELVRSLVTPELMQRVAEEYEKGRLLLIGTTNLDAQRAVVWNMGEIAKSGHPDAITLFQDVLIASSAIPGAFPPVLVDVEIDGTPYQEMHVDGGTVAQVSIYPPSVNLSRFSADYPIGRERSVYIIRNAQLDPTWEQVDPRALKIAGRAISALVQTQGIGDLYRIYLQSLRDNIDFNLAFIPTEFDDEKSEEFDTKFMNALFDLGYDLARNGYPWDKFPPGYSPGTLEDRSG